MARRPARQDAAVAETIASFRYDAIAAKDGE